MQNRLELKISNNNLNPQELDKVLKEITNRTDYFRQWQSRLTGIEDIFATDKNKGTTFEQHKAKFQNKSVEEQGNVLRNLDKLINNYQSQFEELYEIYGNQRNAPREIIEEFKANGRTNRTKLLDALKQTNKTFADLQKSENWQKLSKNEQTKETELFRNLGIDARHLRLKQLEKNLRPCEHDHAFNCFQELDKSQKLNLTNKIDQFSLLSHREKAETVGTIRRQLIKLIKNKYAPYRNVLSQKDITGIENYLPRTNNEDLPAWYLNADRTIADAKQADNLAKKFEPEILDHFDWQNLFTHERLHLLNDNTIEKYENKEHINCEKKYLKKLDKYAKYNGYGLINAEGKKAYHDWYRNLNLEQKKVILEKPEKDYLEQTLKQRTQNVDQFLELPKPIQQEYQNKFRNSDFEERTELITEITNQIEICNPKFETKVDDMVSNRLLAPKSGELYKEWYTNELNLKEKARFLKKSDLDKPQRQEFLNLFEQITDSPEFNELSAKQQKKHNEEFTNADLETRITIITDLGKQYLDDPKAGVNTKDLLKQIRTKDTLKTNTLELYATETEKLEEKANDYEDDGNYEKAKIHYQDALDLIDKDKDPQRATELQQKINEMADLQRILDGIESENPLHNQIDQEITNQLKNPDLNNDLQHFTIMYLAYKAVKNSELQTKAYTAQERVHNGLRQLSTDPIAELDDEITALKGQETQITKDEDGHLGLTNTIFFNGDEYADSNQEDYDAKMVNRFANIQTTPPEKRRFDELCLRDDEENEITATKYFATKVAPKEKQIKQTLTANIAENMSTDLQEAPTIQKALEKLINKRVNAVSSRRLTVALSAKQ